MASSIPDVVAWVGPGLQVDSHPLPLLARPHALRRTTYLQALRRRGSPLVKRLQAQAALSAAAGGTM